MDNKPLVSVIVCTFNRASMLRECLDSVLKQATAELEVIVVDDGSTDETQEVLESYSATLVILRQENRGPGAARNVGAQHARGEYVFFLDSDDCWCPWTFSVLSKVLTRPSPPRFVVGSGIDYDAYRNQVARDAEVSSQPSSVAFRQYPILGECYLAFRPHPWFPSGIGIKREALLEVGGFTARSINCEDIDLWFRLARVEQVAFIDEPQLFVRRTHGHQLTADAVRAYHGCLMLFFKECSAQYPGLQFRPLRIVMLLHIFKHFTKQLTLQGFPVAARILSFSRSLLFWSSPAARLLLSRGRVSPQGVESVIESLG